MFPWLPIPRKNKQTKKWQIKTRVPGSVHVATCADTQPLCGLTSSGMIPGSLPSSLPTPQEKISFLLWHFGIPPQRLAPSHLPKVHAPTLCTSLPKCHFLRRSFPRAPYPAQPSFPHPSPHPFVDGVVCKWRPFLLVNLFVFYLSTKMKADVTKLILRCISMTENGAQHIWGPWHM